MKRDRRNEEIALRPILGKGRLRKKRGIWLYRSGKPLSAAVVDRTLQEVRQERDEDNLGTRRSC